MLDGEMLDAGVTQQVECQTLNLEVGGSKPPARVSHKRLGVPRPPRWTPEEYDYLSSIYQEKPDRSNLWFSYECTEKFGRSLTENAIRGALYRLRLRATIELRPGRVHWHKRKALLTLETQPNEEPDLYDIFICY